MTTTAQLLEVPIGDVDTADNVRTDLGDLADLAASIKANGIVQPITVDSDGNGGYVVVTGHRRLAAAKLAKLTTVPVIVDVVVWDPDNRLVVQMVENLQRADLNPLDEAAGYVALREQGLKQRDIAGRVGKALSHVQRRLALVTLPDVVQTEVRAGKVSLDDAATLAEVIKTNPAGDVETTAQIVENVAFGSGASHGPIENRIAEQVRSFRSAVLLTRRQAQWEESAAEVLDKPKHQGKGYRWVGQYAVDDDTKRLPIPKAGLPFVAVHLSTAWGGDLNETVYLTDDTQAAKLGKKLGAEIVERVAEDGNQLERQAKRAATEKRMRKAVDNILSELFGDVPKPRVDPWSGLLVATAAHNATDYGGRIHDYNAERTLTHLGISIPDPSPVEMQTGEEVDPTDAAESGVDLGQLLADWLGRDQVNWTRYLQYTAFRSTLDKLSLGQTWQTNGWIRDQVVAILESKGHKIPKWLKVDLD